VGNANAIVGVGDVNDVGNGIRDTVTDLFFFLENALFSIT